MRGRKRGKKITTHKKVKVEALGVWRAVDERLRLWESVAKWEGTVVRSQ